MSRAGAPTDSERGQDRFLLLGAELQLILGEFSKPKVYGRKKGRGKSPRQRNSICHSMLGNEEDHGVLLFF